MSSDDTVFFDIVSPQVNDSISSTLSTMLASSVNFEISQAAVSYALKRLWIEAPDDDASAA